MAIDTTDPLTAALIAAQQNPPLKGDRGAKGETGRAGEKGDTGYQGLEGPTGPMGPDGPKGDQGPEGPEGKRGPRGFKGDEGEKGDKGDEGPPGPPGGIVGGSKGTYLTRGLASGMVIDDEGTKINGGAVVGELDFAGSGVSVAMSGGKAVATITGGSGLPSGGTVGQVVTNTGPGTGDWEDSSGLPPQWTDGGNGDVTATTDDNTKTALTIVGLAGQGQSTPLLSLKRDTGESAFRVAQDPTGTSGVFGDDAGPTSHQWGVDASPGVYNQATFQMRVSGQKVRFDSYEDLVDPTQSYTEVRLQMHTGQVLPVFRMLFDSGDPALQVLATGAVASADSLGLFGVTPPAQQTIDAPNATPEQIANILIAYGLAVQAP